jgi:hypothetical protein
VPLSDAGVTTLQNMLYADASDTNGFYQFKVPAGSYDFHASKRGYFPQTLTATATASGTLSLDFALSKMGIGSAQGFAYIVDHLVIAEICASVDGNDQVEYVKIYNPTPNAFVMSNAGVPAYRLELKQSGGTSVVQLSPPSATIYNSMVIPSHGYFLFASTPNVRAVAADAYYSDATRTVPVMDNRIPKSLGMGVRLVSEGINESSGTVVDAVGFDHGGSPWGPSGFREANGFSVSGSGGLDDNETVERLAVSTATHSTMDLAGIHATQGNGYDSDDNSTDFCYHNHSTAANPQNSASIENPAAGTPAVGAAAFMDDGLSVSAVAMGVPTPGSFTVANIATGTWNLVVSSRGYVYEQSGVVINLGTSVNLGSIFISSPASKGFVSGRVVNAGGTPLSNIKVETSFGIYDYTDSAGLYRFQIDGGTHIITANPNNLAASYTTGEATGVVVNVGQQVTVPDIYLFQGGSVRGFVSSNGTDPLPGIPVVATNSAGVEVGATVTDNYGYFKFSNLPIDTYGIVPQLESGEAATPAVFTSTIAAGNTVFAGTMTVTNAFGKIKGNVTAASKPITTGVLIVAVPSPNTIASTYPPTVNQTLRNGSVVYYVCSSESDGTFELPARGGVTYNIYAWYTTVTSGSATTSKLSAAAALTAGGSTTVNFAW